MFPDQIPIPLAFQAFGPDARLIDPKQEAKVKAIGATFAEQLQKLNS
jgi:hypothetical protein